MILMSILNKMKLKGKKRKKDLKKVISATAGNRTRANALEGRYPTIGLQTRLHFIFLIFISPFQIDIYNQINDFFFNLIKKVISLIILLKKVRNH